MPHSFHKTIKADSIPINKSPIPIRMTIKLGKNLNLALLWRSFFYVGNHQYLYEPSVLNLI